MNWRSVVKPHLEKRFDLMKKKSLFERLLLFQTKDLFKSRAEIAQFVSKF